ncbi:MAG: DNRLRE domain-containing protein, partial [Planctomycetota bacterium]
VLELHCSHGSYGFLPGKSRLTVYALNRDWDEATATYVQRKAGPGGKVNWTQPGAMIDRDTRTDWGRGSNGKVAEHAPNVGGWARFDITRLAIAWHSGAKPNCGVYLRPEYKGLANFFSREHHSRNLRPRLVLTFKSKPLRESLPHELDPRDAKIFALAGPDAAKDFAREFALNRFAQRPDAARTPVSLGRGQLAADISPGDIMVVSSRTRSFERECSASFRIDCSERRYKDRGHSTLGFVVTEGQGLDGRIGMSAVLVYSRREVISALVRSVSHGPRRNRMAEGKSIQAGEKLLEPWNVRISWKSPYVAWFINGQRVGMTRLSEEDARKVSTSAVALYWGMYPSRDMTATAKVKVSRIALGKPHEKDFEGAERLPVAPRVMDPPEPRPRPRPRPPRPGP